jgi:2-keto-4-pentenoate hydratase/2-oxohepta-3-ene-1,7-dioic acid hydratase in catechol pathway
MRFLMYSREGSRHPGILISQGVVDLNILFNLARDGVQMRFSSLREFIASSPNAVEEVKVALEACRLGVLRNQNGIIPLDEITIKAPLPDTHKLVLLAGNYQEHIREVGFRVPPSAGSITPQFFLKPASTTVIGPEEPVILSRQNSWVDWEVELAVVFGKRGRDIPEEKALDFVFGYTILNDISERKFNQNLTNRFLREKDPFFDWLHGKWFDSFAPMGPVIVTREEISDPHDLHLTLKHNGIVQQAGHTSQMLHKIPYLIHKLSQILSIEPGDVLSTGTPGGVGISKGILLKAGDELICDIEPIGKLRNTIKLEY